jgi:hypothetical protein
VTGKQRITNPNVRRNTLVLPTINMFAFVLVVNWHERTACCHMNRIQRRNSALRRLQHCLRLYFVTIGYEQAQIVMEYWNLSTAAQWADLRGRSKHRWKLSYKFLIVTLETQTGVAICGHFKNVIWGKQTPNICRKWWEGQLTNAQWKTCTSLPNGYDLPSHYRWQLACK